MSRPERRLKAPGEVDQTEVAIICEGRWLVAAGGRVQQVVIRCVSGSGELCVGFGEMMKLGSHHMDGEDGDWRWER